MGGRHSSLELLASQIDVYLRSLQNPEASIDDLLAVTAETDAYVDLATLVDRVIEACGETGRIVHIPAEHCAIHAPATPLALTIASLFSVATAGPPVGDTLDVRTTRSGSRAQVIITAHVAAPRYARALTAAQQVARSYGGDLVINARLGFTRYCLDLPAAGRSPKGTVSVLLVDDSVEQVAALAELLERDGVAVDVATSGADALMRLRHDAPDVLVSDVQLPDMSGIDVIRRARSERPQLRAVLMSGYPSDHPSIANVLPEISAYFSKPIDVDELFEVVAARGLERG
jgi:CheY-like chemotaxis protein